MSALYVHVPFCQSKCFYCSFVISVGQLKKQEEYVFSLLTESRNYQRVSVDTIYFGGGTPSLLSLHEWKSLLEGVFENFEVRDDCEITIECNPESVTEDKLLLWKDFGVNRLSLGVQTFHDHFLTSLGRTHDADLARRTFGLMRRVGFQNLSFDLMFSFPGQNLKDLKEDLNEVKSFCPEHVSLYSLNIEKNSRFHVKGVSLPDEDVQVSFYEEVVSCLNEQGLLQYEVSNFARKGHQSKHNINYWKSGEYIGLGVGAHSHLNGKRFWNVDRLQDYFRRIQSEGLAIQGEEVLTKAQSFYEEMLFGLRMIDGVDLEEIRVKHRFLISEELESKINELIDAKYLVREKGRLKPTSKGMLILDEMAAHLIEVE